VVRQTFQLARCGCTLRVTSQTFDNFDLTLRLLIRYYKYYSLRLWENFVWSLVRNVLQPCCWRKLSTGCRF
jgi:hypothetical protein